jgi:alpha-tubulin suppressor-like RCC1 family protein
VEQPKVVRCTGRGSTNEDLLTGEDVTQLTAGRGHACALLASGGVRCWGADVHGQVGEGNRDVKHFPPEAAKVGPSAEVRAGYDHTCARLRDNTVVCWGDNKHHQMADGTTDSRLEPVRIQGLYSVTELAAAGDATCAVMSLDHSVRCWGANGSAQLGDGTNEEHTVPMPLRWGVSSK